MLDLPDLMTMYRRFGGPALSAAVAANEENKLAYDDVISLTLPQPYSGEVILRPATNDLFTFDEVFLTEVYGDIKLCQSEVRTVIDLGANIGLASIYFLHHFPSCSVLSVEPDAMNFRLLCKNLSQYTANRGVNTLHAALWKDDGQVVFEPSTLRHEVNKGSARSLSRGAELESGIVVQSFSMGSILAKSGYEVVDLLKVDIEGGEQQLFFGNVDWLSRVRCIAIEFHGSSRRISHFDDVMAEHGFTITEPNPHTVIARR